MTRRARIDTPPRIPNGPQLLCRKCGAVANHMSGLCLAHRPAEPGESRADALYRRWVVERDRGDRDG